MLEWLRLTPDAHTTRLLMPSRAFCPSSPLPAASDAAPQVLEWLRLTLDAHTARLLMSRGSVPAVPALERCLRQQLNGSQQLLPLLGTVEHIEQQAPLPAAHVAAATQYTVELLDLRIRTT